LDDVHFTCSNLPAVMAGSVGLHPPLASEVSCGVSTMIATDQELKITRERVSYLVDLLARLRISSRPEELALVSSGYRAEVERMQREVLDYLTQPATAKAGQPKTPTAPV